MNTMQLTPPQAVTLAGKKRSFGRGLLLTIVTLGLYAYYWHYKALNEIYQQERKQDFPIALFILACIPFLNIIGQPLYMSNLLDTLNSVRHQRNLPPIFGLGGFLAWYILGAFIIVGPFVAYSKIQGAINEYWDHEARRVSLQPMGQTPAPPHANPQAP